jgi:hypothetical protein
VATWGLRVKVA